jgi:hypothetical protein
LAQLARNLAILWLTKFGQKKLWHNGIAHGMLVLWHNGTMAHSSWYAGIMAQWHNGTMAHSIWHNGTKMAQR